MLQIAYPWELLAIVLPFLIRYLLKPAVAAQSTALKVPYFKQLLNSFANLKPAESATPLSSLKYLATLIWILLVLSGSGIQWLGKPLLLAESGRDLLMAIDLSGSMQTPDMLVKGQSISRIDLVKQVASQFISKRTGDRIGLLLFGTRPYLQTPLTFDRTTVKQMLNDASLGIAGEQTAIGDAIGLAVKKLIDLPSTSKALILMTDGGNNAGSLDPLVASELAKKAKIKIYSIGIGAQKMEVDTLFGRRIINPAQDLDIETLGKIATMTGGKFFRAEDGKDLANIYSIINQLEPVQSDKVTVRPTTPFYPWFLSSALLLSMLLILLKYRVRNA